MSNQQVFDVVVVGSGGAGLTAALAARDAGARVLVVEKSGYIGGTTAISGGWMWMPGNRSSTAAGDTREQIELYLRNLAGSSWRAEHVGAFLDAAPEVVDFLERSGVELRYPEVLADYEMNVPGAFDRGRSVAARPVSGRVLSEGNRLRVRPYLYPMTVFGYMTEVGDDLATFLRANRSLRAFGYVMAKLTRAWLETAIYRRSLTRTNGNALVTRLVAATEKAGIPIWTGAGVSKLLSDGDGTPTGVAIDEGPHAGEVIARQGVVLACGGFGGNAVLRSRFFPHDPDGENHETATIGHDGDAFMLARSLGAKIDADQRQPAAWTPVTSWKSLFGRKDKFVHVRAFCLPGTIAVDRQGRRFANEALSYHSFGQAMIHNDEQQPETFCYIVADSRAMHYYGIGCAKPWPVPRWYHKKVGYLIEGRTIQDLASKIGIPASNLSSTLSEFNSAADEGHDPAFARGTDWYQNAKGDPSHKPNPNIAPLRKPPFYAVKVLLGDLGTFAGLATDPDGRVLTEQGEPIPRLYAAGAAAASAFGGAYPGYGAMIGPAIVGGYTSGRLAARQAALAVTDGAANAER